MVSKDNMRSSSSLVKKILVKTPDLVQISGSTVVSRNFHLFLSEIRLEKVKSKYIINHMRKPLFIPYLEEMDYINRFHALTFSTKEVVIRSARLNTHEHAQILENFFSEASSDFTGESFINIFSDSDIVYCKAAVALLYLHMRKYDLARDFFRTLDLSCLPSLYVEPYEEIVKKLFDSELDAWLQVNSWLEIRKEILQSKLIE